MLQTEFIPAVQKDSRHLLVMLHGLGDSTRGYRWLPEALNLPWLNYLLVNAPDAYYDGWSWFDLQDLTPGILRSRKVLSALLDDLRAKGYPADHITLGGFSQGCLMTIDVGLRYPHRLAGLIGISGWVFEPEILLQEMPPAAKEQRLLITHGLFDPVVSIVNVRAQVKGLKAAGLNAAWHEFPKAHTIHGEEELSVIREFMRAGHAVVGK